MFIRYIILFTILLSSMITQDSKKSKKTNINIPITEISKPWTSAKKAGSIIITGKVGIENAKAGNA